MLEMLLANVYFLYQHSTLHSKTMNEFKEDTKWLVSELTLPKYNRTFANVHYLAPIPPTDKNQRPTRKCQFCNVPGQEGRKETRYFCVYYK